ncbi:hypothetical protein C1T17_07490 [Sphingobium sp. SCG-1]|uniref:flagellar hook-length control protein FliK n=1 Tax=Sphingobium sp. SCG-1 TaxID=2072936 RepID=UPI000CD6765C|nr:flagellar hook-length control protein FliK [Sphingobium sp. SCG-1]AUW57971.1 hypothetical protein C1T17_07490 [Sphingobium sp. SCG-1]
MNAIMGNLGKAVSQLPPSSAGASKPATGKEGAPAPRFAAMLSDVANSTASGRQAAPAPVEGEAAGAPSSGDLALADLPFTAYSEVGATGANVLTAASPDAGMKSLAPQKPFTKQRAEPAPSLTNAAVETGNADPEVDATTPVSEDEIDIGAALAQSSQPGDPVVVPTTQTVRVAPPLETPPGKSTKAEKAPMAIGTDKTGAALQDAVPQPTVNLPPVVDKPRAPGATVKKAVTADSRAQMVADGDTQPAPLVRQQNATVPLLAGLARQKDLPPEVTAKLMGLTAVQPSVKSDGKDAGATLPDVAGLKSAAQGVSALLSHKGREELAMMASVLPAQERAKPLDRALSDTTTLSVDGAVAPAASNPTLGYAIQSPAAAPVTDLSASLGQQVIDMGSGGQWIDGLAREIAALSKGEGHGSFRLSPENLGPMRVDIRPGEQGANVTLTVETKAAESMLMQDRNLLKADAQLAAVKIDEVTVQRVAHVHEPSRADTATGQGTGGQSQSQTQTSSQGQSGQGSNNAALAQGQNQSGQNGNNPRNHKVSSDATVSSQAEPRDTADSRSSDTTRRARYA